MDQPETVPETVTVTTRRVACDGATGIRQGRGVAPAALGHPRVWLEIDERGHVDCGYCDKRFVLAGDSHAVGSREVMPGDLPAPGDGSVA